MSEPERLGKVLLRPDDRRVYDRLCAKLERELAALQAGAKVSFTLAREKGGKISEDGTFFERREYPLQE